MLEAGLVSLAILVSTWWACRTARIQGTRRDDAREAQTIAFQNMRVGLEASILSAADDTRDVLRLLILAVENQHHADLITGLAESLTEHMTALNSRMDTMDKEWFDLSTRVQNGAAHKFLRVP